MNDSAVGLDLDPVRPNIAHYSQDGVLRSLNEYRPNFPPSLIAPASRTGSFLLDAHFPARAGGSGISSQEDPTRARIPLAYLWELLLRRPESRILAGDESHHRHGVRVAELLASATSAVLAGNGAHRSRLCALVVPNCIQEQAQDELLRECRRLLQRARSQTRVELVWRPIAAALRWLHDYHNTLEPDFLTERASLGSVLHIHLGVEGFESTLLEVIPFKEAEATWILPGRRLPETLDLLPGLPVDLLEDLVSFQAQAVEPQRQAAYRRAWNALWVSPLLDRLVAQSPQASQSPMPPWHNEHLAEVVRTDFHRRLFGPRAARIRWFPELKEVGDGNSGASIDVWLSQTSRMVRPELLGAIITGPLASVPAPGGTTLGRDIARRLSLRGTRLVVEGAGDSQLLAEGAAIYASRRIANEPTHLDTLPKVTAIVMRRGEPIWENLLEMKDPWVPGGRTWKHVPELVRFQIDRGQANLELTIHREGALKCKKVGVEFRRALDRACPVTLSIEMEPGQGHPRVEVVPNDRSMFREQSIYLDWQTAPEAGTQDEELKSIERICPPIEERRASRNRWLDRQFMSIDLGGKTGVRSLLEDYLQQPNTWTVRGSKKLDFLNGCLKETKLDDQGRLTSPISSDGLVAGSASDQNVLQVFLAAIDTRLEDPDLDIQRDCLKILGSASAQTPNLLRRLRDELAASVPRRARLTRELHWEGAAALPRHHRNAICWACGNCLRIPEDIELFYVYFESTSIRPSEATAMATLLMYREDALEGVPSNRVEAWMRLLLPSLGNQPVGNRMKLAQNRAAMAIAYLLRRRCFDSGFLPVGSTLHLELKSAVEHVHRPPRRGDTQGVKRTLEALRLILDYIDKKGRGRLTALMVDNDDDSDNDDQE